MLDELQKTDDPAHPWPKAELLSAVGIPVKTKNFLCNLYWENEDSVSLNQVFELVVSDQEDPRPGYIVSPLISLRNVGPKTFLEIIKILNRCNMGKKCNAQWARRHRRLMAAKRLVLKPGSPWSTARPTG